MPTLITADNLAANTITSEKISSTVALGGPKIANVQIANSSWSVLDDTAVDVGGGYLLINGTGFVTGCSVLLDTTSASSVTFVSSTQLRVVAQAKSAATYNAYVVNPDGGTATRVNGITYSASPSWVTASALANVATKTAYSYQLTATGAASYSLQAGSSLPANSSLAANGLFSGNTDVASDTSYSFTVLATDNELQDSPRTFSFTVTAIAAPDIYLKGEEEPLVDSSSSPLSLSISGVSRSQNQVNTGSYSILINGTNKNISFGGTNSSDWDLGVNKGTNIISGAFEMQIYPMSPAASRCAIIGRYNEPGELGWTVDYNNNGALFLAVNGSGSQSDNGLLTLNQWQKLALVYENNSGTFQVKIYKNNSLITTYNMSSATSPSSGYSLMLAPRSGSLSLNAYIDEFKFWKGSRGPY